MDLSKHTLYVRMRYLVTVRPLEGDEIKIASDWSEVASVGKDAANTADILKDIIIEAPLVSDLRMTDETFNEFSVIAFTIEIPDSLVELETLLKANSSGYVGLETEARVMGKNEWTPLQGDFALKSGEMKIALQNLAVAEGSITKDTPIEFRAKYVVYTGEAEPIISPYSEILTFGSLDMQVTEGTTDDTTEESVTVIATQTTTEEVVTEKPKKDKCSLCGFCPHPLGICIFIWIAIIVIIAVVVVIVILKKKKDKKE